MVKNVNKTIITIHVNGLNSSVKGKVCQTGLRITEDCSVNKKVTKNLTIEMWKNSYLILQTVLWLC